MNQKKERYIQQKSEYIDILNFVNFHMKNQKVITVLLSGPPGIGKTFMCEEIAKELSCEYKEINGHPGLSREDLEGIPLLKNGDSDWQDGVIPIAFKQTNKDGLCLLGIHEFNLMRMELQPSINSVMDYQGKFALTTNANKLYTIDEGNTLVIIATINEDIAGVMPIQDSVKSRFDFKINLGYPREKLESEILNMKTGIKIQFAKVICKFANELRKAFYNGQLTRAVSPRELISFCRALKVPGIAIKTCFEYSIINKIAEVQEDVKLINDLADGNALFSQLNNVEFEGQPSRKPEFKEEVKPVEIKEIQKDYTDVKTLNFNRQSMQIRNGRVYTVNAMPSKVELNGKEYDVIRKGKWVPTNIWIAKILGRNNGLELHFKRPDGKKDIRSPRVRFNLI